MSKKIVIGITGASGVIYGVRLLDYLQKAGHETHLIITAAGKLNITIETAYSVEQVCAMSDHVYDPDDLAATLASGSFLTEGMAVAPCTIKTLSAIANAYTSSLLVRAADVALKEKRRLVLVVRETPLHQGHLRLMSLAAEMGAVILPPMPAFYHHPQTVDDIVDQTVGKICDALGVEHHLFARWGQGEPDISPLNV